MRTRKDTYGRVWEHCDCEGTWTHFPTEGERIEIGCGANNGSKWMVWNGDAKHPEEFKTLSACMQSTFVA